MGRGRQKAKHTKLARELKSFSPDVNFASLERELGNKTEGSYDDEFDKWADYTEYESADEESAEESA
ncbi:MAG TPA: DUF3073 domain-containing protein [Candidatus Agrococcus pullicola]|uniref:DUF3073 domain-containing protein n=1 Tax=Candidatus Agrococcus pullicola TaxID=2838429 RepID=A0A9D1YVP5_9MICO|nr:DUF3073 domain-containing protein [Candidatus Agrococcus pullicola]